MTFTRTIMYRDYKICEVREETATWRFELYDRAGKFYGGQQSEAAARKVIDLWHTRAARAA